MYQVDPKSTAPAVYSIIILTIYKYIDLLSLYVTLLPPLQRKQCYDINVYKSIHHVTVFKPVSPKSFASVLDRREYNFWPAVVSCSASELAI
jgi:hypothetical protein